MIQSVEIVTGVVCQILKGQEAENQMQIKFQAIIIEGEIMKLY